MTDTDLQLLERVLTRLAVASDDLSLSNALSALLPATLRTLTACANGAKSDAVRAKVYEQRSHCQCIFFVSVC